MNSKSLNITSATLFISKDPDWRRKIFLGGLILLIPLIGWPILMGYRKVAIERLWGRSYPLLPEWESKYKYLLEGIKCCLIIFVYLLPVTFLFWYEIYTLGLISNGPWIEISIILFIFPIFTPLALPATVVYLMLFSSIKLSLSIGIIIIIIYFLLVFLIPLGFFQVSITGKYFSAFNIKECAKFIGRNFWNYLHAWINSSIISLIGHFCIPFSPWGVTWAYLGIVYSFNEVLFIDHLREKYDDLPDSWYEYFENVDWESSRVRSNFLNNKYKIDNGVPFWTFVLGTLEIPLPQILKRS